MRLLRLSCAVAALSAVACSGSSSNGGGDVLPYTNGSGAASGSSAGSGSSSSGSTSSGGASGSASSGTPIASSGTASSSGTGGAPSFVGSPLCHAGGVDHSCYPDTPTTAAACGVAPDGGPYDPDAGYGDTPVGCHVVVRDSGIPAPECWPAGLNQDGASCVASTDCAPGSDCVGTPGVCRHYCCMSDGPCGSGEFCDIQPTATNPAERVPVCVPIHSCGLLDQRSDAGACSSTQTCAVARLDTGVTSCTRIGAAAEGDNCDTDHCASGLTCLGPTKSVAGHSCFKLCHTQAPVECAANQICHGGWPTFPNPLVGVCEDATD
jgi:hypothetical protein